jgi:hypothetical protein
MENRAYEKWRYEVVTEMIARKVVARGQRKFASKLVAELETGPKAVTPSPMDRWASGELPADFVFAMFFEDA